MKKRNRVLINIFTIFIILFNLFIPKVYADGELKDIISGGDNFIENGNNGNNTISESALKKGSNLLYNVLFVIGIATALIWGLVLAIQFITGSIIEKADVKKGLMVYVIGCTIIFGAFGIWRLVVQLLQNFE